MYQKKSATSYADINVHKFTKKFPNSSFLKISQDVNISCPELIFCQMANLLPLEQLALYGMEICATYSIDNLYEKGFHSHKLPLTSPKKILNYINRISKNQNNIKGITKAKKAAKLLALNSASPQESRVYMMLCAPTSLGGFNIKNTKLNYPIMLSRKASDLCGKSQVFADICIPSHKVVIEYDSDAFHDNTNQNRKDKSRINALNHDNWKVFSIVPNIIHNEEAFKNIAIDIIKATGVRPRIRVKNHDKLRHQLYCNLFHNL